MKELGIVTAVDLRAKDETFLSKHFGKAGRHFYYICRGIDSRPVLPNRIRKSVGAENTFLRDLTALDELKAELAPLVEKIWQYCDSASVRGRTVTLKVKFSDFQTPARNGVRKPLGFLRALRGPRQGDRRGLSGPASRWALCLHGLDGSRPTRFLRDSAKGHSDTWQHAGVTAAGSADLPF